MRLRSTPPTTPVRRRSDGPGVGARATGAVLAVALGILVGALSGRPAAAAPLPGTAANVTWTSGTVGSSTGSGTFDCAVTATMSMAAGDFNSGVAYPIDWSTSTATASAFAGGITPSSGIAVYARSAGNSGTIAFGAEITDPVVLVAYIDPGAAMDFGPNPITVLSYYSSVAGAPTVTGNKIALDGPVIDNEDEGWAVRVTGTFGPTSGPMPFTTYSTSGETMGVSVASTTICPPPPPLPPGRPGPPTVTPRIGALEVTVSPPTTGGIPESYLVTAEPGGATCTVTGTSGSCTIEGLLSEQAYTVTVIASNTGGDSPASEASAPVTPLADESAPTTQPSALPATGSDATILADLGLAVLAIGAFSTALTLRRRRIDETGTH